VNSEDQNLPAEPQKNSAKDYVWMSLAASVLAFIVIKDLGIPKPVIALGAAIAGIMLLAKGMEKPQLVTYALVAYLPFSKKLAGDFGGLATAFNFTNLLLIFICWVWITGKYQPWERRWQSTSMNLPIYIFLAMGLVSVFRGTYYDGGHLFHAILEYKRWITPIFLYFLVLNTVRDRDMVKNVSMIIMIVTTVVALMAIYDYIDQGDAGSLEKSRIGGIADQPNMLAAFFCYYMFMYLAFFYNNIGKGKYWLLLIPFLLCFRGIMVCFSRGGYLAFALGLYATTFFRSKVFFGILLVLSVIVYMNPVLLPAGVRFRMGQTFTGGGGADESTFQSLDNAEAKLETSSKRRVDVWKAAMVMIKENPVFGIGYRTFEHQIQFYWDGGTMDAHNTYIIIAAEMGVPALIAFVLIILIILWESILLYYTTRNPYAKSLALGFVGGLFGMLLSNMFGSRLDAQEVSSYFWILAALIMRLRLLDKWEGGQPEMGLMGPREPQSSGSPEAEPSRKPKRNTLDACWQDP